MQPRVTGAVVAVLVATAAGCGDKGDPVLAPVTLPGQAIVMAQGGQLELPIHTLMATPGVPLLPARGDNAPTPVPAQKVEVTSDAPTIVQAVARGAMVDLTALTPGKATLTVAGNYKQIRTSITFTVDVKAPTAVNLSLNLANPDYVRRELTSGGRITLARGLCYPVQAAPVLDGGDARVRYPTLLAGDGVVSPGACEELSLYSADARTVAVGKIGTAAPISVEFVEPTFALEAYGDGHANLVGKTATGEPLALPHMLFRESRSATPAACTAVEPPTTPRFAFAANGRFAPTPAGGACNVVVEIAQTKEAPTAAFTVTLPWPAEPKAP